MWLKSVQLITFPMKFKNQLRWLVFLIVPFVTFLTIHLVVPVTFVLKSYPSFKTYYFDQKIEQEQSVLRSSSLLSQNTVTDMLRHFTNSQQSLINLFNASSTIMDINTNNIYLTNAYTYSLSIASQGLNLNTTRNQSMWFATGVSNSSQLNASQLAVQRSYKIIDPYVKSLFFQTDSQLVYSHSLYVTDNSSDSIFEYPSRYSSQWSNQTATVLDSYYAQTISVFNQNNGSSASVPFRTYQNNVSLLVLCSAEQVNSFTLVSCLKLQLNILAPYLANRLLSLNGIDYNASLVMSSDASSLNIANPQILLIAANSSFSIPQGQYFDLSQAGIPRDALSSSDNSLSQSLYIKKQGQSVYYINPILITGSYISFHLISAFTSIKKDGFGSTQSQTITQLLIPVIVLILIASAISICVMKTLLNSIDHQLYQLQSRLKFIVDGDINIEIPEHEGTEDIKDLYDKVRVVNKLHRYTTEHYFRGYFTEKILKYNQALQFIKGLNYDTCHLLQNMGEAAMWAEDWQMARSTLKESVHLQMSKMQDLFGSIDEMIPLKNARKVPHKYKEMEVVLIRKIFKLNFVYFRYLELKQIFTHKDADESLLDQLNFKKKQEELMKQATHYMNIQKKVFLPDYSTYSQCILTLLNQCKQYSNLGNLTEASNLLDRTTKIIQKYCAEYGKVTKLLKEKGSKHKFLKWRMKLTTHSRTPPDIMKTFRNLYKAKILYVETKKPSKFIEFINVLDDGARVGSFTAALTYLSMLEIRKAVLELQLDVQPFETTQIFRQSLPWRTLHYGPINKEDQANFLKFPTRFSTGLEKQFIFIFDCSRQMVPDLDQKLREYQSERIVHIFQKLVKNRDRMSIIRHGTKVGVEVHCGLILKQYNQTVLKMNLSESIDERNPRKQEIGIIQSLYRAIMRNKHLKSEKVIIMFFRRIEDYREQFRKATKKRKTKASRESKYNRDKIESLSQNPEGYPPLAFGTFVEEIFQQEGLRNFKLILYTANGQEHETFRQFFGLEQINRRIWSSFGGINKWNNTVYVIEEKHKPDIDRLLMLKTQFIAENHVFFL